MSFPKLLPSSTSPYHVTARVNNQEAFPCELSRVWRIVERQLFEIHVLFRAEVHAFVLMPNHFHLLVTTPREGLGRVMNHFMRSVAQSIVRASDRTGHVFGGRHYRSLIASDLYLWHALKYIYRNPVKAGLCDRVEDYPYSSLAGVIGLQPLAFPMVPPPLADLRMEFESPEARESWLRWLNQPHGSETDAMMRRGFRRQTFKVPRGVWNRSLLAETGGWNSRRE